MDVIILGSGTGVPRVRRGAPGVAVKLEQSLVLFDLGCGALQKLAQAGLDYKEVEALFFTHLHCDHVADLMPFLFATRNTPDFTRQGDLFLYGPAGLQGFYEGLAAVYGRQVQADSYRVFVHELLTSHISLGKAQVFSRPVLHRAPSLGFRVEEAGRSMAYSGDTDYCPEMVELGREADLLILECSFPDERRVAGHLTPRLAGRIAAESGCNRLALTHFYPICDDYDLLGECRAVFGGDIIVSEDLMRFSL